MKIVKDDLPTEGIMIADILFLPSVIVEMSASIAKELIKRKGFREVKNAKEVGK